MNDSSLMPATAALALVERIDTDRLMADAARQRDAGHGAVMTYSREIVLPIARLGSDAWYPGAVSPQDGIAPVRADDVLAAARRGEAAGCTAALFRLDEGPDRCAPADRDALAMRARCLSVSSLHTLAERVVEATGLLPRLDPGIASVDELASLRDVSASLALLLGTAARSSGQAGGDFRPLWDEHAARLATIRAAGTLRIPVTCGIVVGRRETRRDQIENLLALRALDREFGHVQAVVVQPLGVGAGRERGRDASAEELIWSIAAARLIFGPAMTIATSPDLPPDLLDAVIDAGIDDWGSLSPRTADGTGSDTPWPHADALTAHLRGRGRALVPRLPVFPPFAAQPRTWVHENLQPAVLRASDGEHFARETAWSPGQVEPPPAYPTPPSVSGPSRSTNLDRLLAKAEAGTGFTADEIVRLFAARDQDYLDVCAAADELRARTVGDTVRYVVNRNINFTNICLHKCPFCSFSKGRTDPRLRGPAYDLTGEEIGRRAREAWSRGGTEVCLQGGIHPGYTGDTYVAIVRAVKSAVPGMHVHAFSPVELRHGADTLGIPMADYLARLRDEGLNSIPGTGAEVLDDRVRDVICPDKLSVEEWLDVIATAHKLGLRTTASIMFGHIEQPEHWANHLVAIRRLQERTGGFTELVPLPFIHMETPIYLQGHSRRGPTWREAVLMHAVARLALHPVIPNIQVAWMKMGPVGIRTCLHAGANDLGGTLMGDDISRAAGAEFGEELPPQEMDAVIVSSGRVPAQRTTLYGPAPIEQQRASYQARPLAEPVQVPPRRRGQAAGCR